MRYIKLVIILTVLILSAREVDAKLYASLGGSGFGATDSYGISFDLGYYDYLLLDVGTLAILNIDDKLPEPLNSNPISYNDYKEEGLYQKTNEFGFIAKVGLNIFNVKGLYSYIMGGFTYVNQIEIVRANDSGFLYTEYDRYNYYGIYGLGVSFIPDNFYLGGSLEYDNRRGLTLNIVVPLSFINII